MFREHLETVIEAVIDGRVAAMPVAAVTRAHRAPLAGRLRTTYAAVQPSATGKTADLRAAVRLLDLVDDIEKVLH